METLLFDIEIDGIKRELSVAKVNGIYEILHQGKLMLALRPPGEDWEILNINEVVDELPVFEQDLSEKQMNLHTYDINKIIGLIENHHHQGLVN